MGRTSIEWATDVWNPVRGCSRVSKGCRNCYAERFAHRWKNGIYRGIVNESGSHWTGRVELIESKLQDPLHWRKPRRIFVNSMSDLFHEALLFSDILRIYHVMQRAYWHTYMILTKRAPRMLEFTKWLAGSDDISAAEWPRQCWLGVSCENRETLHRLDALRKMPAAVRFVSFEPLLEDLGTLDLTGIHWVIVGGESGPGARLMELDWVRSIRDKCQGAGVAFFFKQWGGVHKSETGRELDGRTWDQFPERTL